MARLSSDASDKTNHESLVSNLEQFTASLVISTKPVIVTGVQRKANTGGYENIDIYCAIATPVDIVEGMTKEEVKELLVEVVEDGFQLVAEETRKRYRQVSTEVKKDKE